MQLILQVGELFRIKKSILAKNCGGLSSPDNGEVTYSDTTY